MAEKLEFSELGRVEATRLLFEGSGFAPFEEPLFYRTREGDCISTATRLFSEGVDFNLVYFPLKHLGYKCVVGVTGELYAVMSCPATLSIVIGISSKLDFEQIRELWGGVVTAAKEYGYKSLSLELQPSQNGLYISLAASGVTEKLICTRRPKAKSKDLVCVSGSLGAAFLGMQVLEREKGRFESGSSDKTEMEKYRMLVGSYLKPELSASLLSHLKDSGITPSYGYFITKGLADAVLRLSRDSGLGVKIYADKIPFEGGSFEFGKLCDIDPISAAMNGGEDYRLLFTIPILELEHFRRDFQTFDIIGHLALSDVGSVLLTPEGVELPLKAQGWRMEDSI